MLYGDYDRRVQELRKIAEVFDKHDLPETASRIIAFEALLQDDISKRVKLAELIDLIELCEFEFGNQDLCGEYRRICFNQIGHAFLDASIVSGENLREAIIGFEPLLNQINQGRKVLGELSKFARNSEINDFINFHLTCYAYVIIVEATFDEMARILFYIYSLKEGKKLTVQQLQKLEVGHISSKLQPEAIFLRNWREKKHIRNAISHATAYYNDSEKSVRFVDNWVEPFDKTMPIRDFAEQLEELSSTIDAFILFSLLMKVSDLLFCLNLFEADAKPIQ